MNICLFGENKGKGGGDVGGGKRNKERIIAVAKKTQLFSKDSQMRLARFYKRWNIDLKDRWLRFNEQALNSFVTCVGRIFEGVNSEAENEFFEIIGSHRPPDILFDFCVRMNGLGNSPVYQYFQKADQIKFLLGLQGVLWMKTIHEDTKEIFFTQLKEAAVITGVPLRLKQTASELILYPEGAKLLDKKLVDDNLEWLSSYPKSHAAFKNALLKIGKEGEERNVVDNLRLSLELLVNGILGNTKSLENRRDQIGGYLKEKNTSTEIANLFNTVLNYYLKYQNDNAKHENKVSSNEVEFILYLTGTFMRFLLTR